MLTEREEMILDWLRREVAGEAMRMMLASGLPGGTRTERVKMAAFAEGVNHAVKALHTAIKTGEHLKRPEPK